MLRSILALILFTSVRGQSCPPGYAEDTSGAILKNQKIVWGPCEEWDIPQLECGSVKVPLDYTGASRGVITLSLVRWCADPKKSNGKSIVYNPGGPGGSGIERLINKGPEYMLSATGEAYNVVSFDPRGCGATIPYPCQRVESNNTISPLSDPTALRNMYTRLMEQGAECAKGPSREIGENMGTAFVARDINAIFDALDEDGLIRYWGFSYGTVLGSTLAAMFPDKIDRMVLDGNINPTEFYHGIYTESVADVDEALKYFFEACYKEGPQYCTFSNFGNSGADLQEKFFEIRDAAQAGQHNLSPEFYQEIRSVLYDALKYPLGYFNASNLLSVAYQQIHPSTPMFEWIESEDNESDPTPMALDAVNCGDWDDIPGTTKDWSEWLIEYTNKSAIFGDSWEALGVLYPCSAWQLNARGKYTGSWTGIRTRTPLLFVNSPWDPATPLESAKNASAGFIGSVVLEHHGPGHCSSGSPSNCTINAVSHYFLTGELPDVSKPCLPNEGAFERSFREDYPATASRSLDKRDPNFEYPMAIRRLQHQNDHLFKREASDKRQSPDVSYVPAPTAPVYDIPAGCTPIAAGNGQDQVLPDEETQKGLSGYKAACDSFTGDRWMYRLVCEAAG